MLQEIATTCYYCEAPLLVETEQHKTAQDFQVLCGVCLDK